MSVLNRFFKGFGFRSALPSFEPGEEITAYVTGYDPDTGNGIVRIGDTILHVPKADRSMVDEQVTLNITSFDKSEHRGEAELVSEPDS